MKRKNLDEINKNTFSLESISCVYTQDGDCGQDSDTTQVIKFETCSNGVASFIRMSLPEGGHWSIDSKEELIDVLEDFMSRFEYNEE